VTFELRLVVIALATFFVAGLVVTPLVPWLWRRTASARDDMRATRLYRLRMLPSAFAFGAMTTASISFYIFEQRQWLESYGVAPKVIALGAALLGMVSIGRAASMWMKTWRLRRLWMAGAQSINIPGVRIPAYCVETAFPIVAVVGARRPTLVIARPVLDACSEEELAAILAHEQGHIARRDNLRRALITAAPDVLSWLPAARRLQQDWHEATEEAADDAAGQLGATGRVALAQALLRVARIAHAAPELPPLPASALYRGENIESRVRRLLADPVVATTLPPFIWRAGAAITIAVCLLTLQAVHTLVEAVVQFLP